MGAINNYFSIEEKVCSIIIITIILDNIEITIIQTITFEFENMIHYSVFLSKKTLCN